MPDQEVFKLDQEALGYLAGGAVEKWNDWWKARLPRYDIEDRRGKADLAGMDLSSRDENNAVRDFSGAVFTKSNLAGANLSSSCFVRADLAYSDLRGADLSKADFQETRFHCSDLTGAKLADAEFAMADASYGRFIDADARGAQFFYADVSKATFEGADLDQANFSSAQVTDTDFSQARNLRSEAFFGVIYDPTRPPRFPDGVGLPAPLEGPSVQRAQSAVLLIHGGVPLLDQALDMNIESRADHDNLAALREAVDELRALLAAEADQVAAMSAVIASLEAENEALRVAALKAGSLGRRVMERFAMRLTDRAADAAAFGAAAGVLYLVGVYGGDLADALFGAPPSHPPKSVTPPIKV
tara:strand:+ start:2972 stop:4042 length:1071 start_codon:yes stop_codon:yes gene_type:complete